jgi:hypothetical protein
LELYLEDGTTRRDPSPEAIANALGDLGRPGNQTATLERGPSAYVLVYAHTRDSCALEYREGPDAPQMVSTDPDISVDQVVRLFQDYAAGADGWRSGIAWGPLDEQKGSGCLSVIAAVIALGALAALGAWVALVP